MNPKPNSQPPTDEFPTPGPRPPLPVVDFEPTYAELRAQANALRSHLVDARTEVSLLTDIVASLTEKYRVSLVKNRAQSGIIRDMLASMDEDAPPVQVEHRILRHWVDSPQERDEAQTALSQRRNDGWNVLDIACMGFDSGPDSPAIALQVVTLERAVKPAAPLPADAPTAAEATVENKEFARAMGERVIQSAEPVATPLSRGFGHPLEGW